MTLSERREPTFHASGRGGDASHSAAEHHAIGVAHHPVKSGSHFTRFVSGFQAISTLIGVPLALASGYSLYRANFAPETTCANLRASIVQMLDKNVDAATRRMLVKRDIESFEANCGAVDPDAHAAFKALLAADKPVMQAAKAAVKPAVVAAKVAPKESAKETIKEAAKDTPKGAVKEAVKTELRPAIVDKKPEVAVQSVAAETEAEPRNAGMSDTRWLDAVRSALVEGPEAAPAGAKPEVAKAEPMKIEPANTQSANTQPAKAEVAEAAKPQPIASEPAKAEAVKAAVKPVVPAKPGDPVLQPAWSVTPPPAMPSAAPSAAAPLPPAVDVASPPEPVRDGGDHPVPPGSVPSAQYATDSSWVGKIPFVGRMIER